MGKRIKNQNILVGSGFLDFFACGSIQGDQCEIEEEAPIAPESNASDEEWDKYLKKLDKYTTKMTKNITETEKKTKENNKISIQLALNYGSKNEIINSLKNIIKKKQKITTKNFEQNLYTAGFPDPDILIRTGGKKRLSNFLLWQMAYTEIFFIDKMWPDFNKNDFKKILNKFKKIKRNFGKI